MRLASFDIETTALDATYGRILCACFKFDDEEKIKTVAARRYKDEPKCLAQIVKWYESADIVVTWNGKLFDIPFVNARLMIRRKDTDKDCPPILNPNKMQIDGRWINNKLRTRGNRLDGAAKDLAIIHQKYDLRGETWVQAADGDRNALAEIVKHCEEDVLITEEVIGVLKPYIIRITK